MQNNDELIEKELNSENIVSPFEPKDIDIATEQNSLATIIDMIKDGVIDLNVEFQRKGNLWDETTMSKLIESILFRLPLPAFYFDASDDNKWLVVDGLQRLSTFKKFVIDNSLVLKELFILKELNGKTYDELEPVLKRRMARYQITTHLIKPGTPKKVKSDIFRRINTGGLLLTSQEIRHSLNQGKPANYLKKLVEDERFTAIFHLEEVEDERFTAIIHFKDNRMQARELILRYLAFSVNGYNKYIQNIDSFLDKTMEDLDAMSEQQLCELENNLWTALNVCEYLFGKDVFTIKYGNVRKFQPILFEVWTVFIGKLNDKDIYRLKTAKSKLIKMSENYFADKSILSSRAKTAFTTEVIITECLQ